MYFPFMKERVKEKFPFMMKERVKEKFLFLLYLGILSELSTDREKYTLKLYLSMMLFIKIMWRHDKKKFHFLPLEILFLGTIGNFLVLVPDSLFIFMFELKIGPWGEKKKKKRIGSCTNRLSAQSGLGCYWESSIFPE